MAGNRNSGRRDKYNEVKVGVLADLSVNWAIKHWEQFTSEEKMKVLLALAPKYVPQKTNIEGEITVNLSDKIKDGRTRASDVMPSRN